MTRIGYAGPEHSLPERLLIEAIEMLSGRAWLQALYDWTTDRVDEGEPFFSCSLEALGIPQPWSEHDLARVPRDGPVVFVANHPFGVIDGLVLCDLAERTRGSFQVMLHTALCREERLRDVLLPVDFGGTEEARRTNIRSTRSALRLLARGGALVVFPSGGIATRGCGLRGLADLPWNPFPARVVRKARATVVPVWFGGSNSALFHAASYVGQVPRLAMIFNEVRNKHGQPLTVRVGEPLVWSELQRAADAVTLTRRLREAVFALADERSRQEDRTTVVPRWLLDGSPDRMVKLRS